MSESTKKPEVIQMISDDEGMIINFAVRYAIGRQTYAPHAVIQYVSPRIPLLNDKTLVVLYNDMKDMVDAGQLGDKRIDEPYCLMFFRSISDEVDRRGLMKYVHKQERMKMMEEPAAAKTASQIVSLIPTCELVAELKKREGVETTIVKPYEYVGVNVDGPAIILKVID